MLTVKAYDSVQMARGILSFLGSPLKSCFYVVDGLVIDTGPRNLGPASIPFLQEAFVEQVALTHLHEDHAGLASWLSETRGARVLIHSGLVEKAAQGSPLPWHRRWSWGNYIPFASAPLPQRIERAHHSFEVIPTPGHTDTHVVFYEKQKGWLFTGDLFVNAHPVQWDPNESADKYFQSFERVLALDFDTIFCGHAGIIRKQGKEAIGQKYEYLLELRDKVTGLYNKGYSLRQIDRSLFPVKPPSTYLTSGKWSSYHLVSSMLESSQAGDRVNLAGGLTKS